MEKRKKIKIIIIVLISLLICLSIVLTGILLSKQNQLDEINKENDKIQERLQNS